MTEEIEQIIEIVKDLPLKEILAFLIGKGIKDVSQKGYEKLKKLIQDKQNEGRYAFVPDKEEANQLLKLYEHPEYTQIKLLIPHCKYIDVIRTGLLIRNYHENDTEQNRRRVLDIKQQVGRRPNGSYLLKLVNLPTTPFFSQILRYLYHLKTQGYTISQLEDKFQEIVDAWSNSSKFFRAENKEKDIKTFCDGQIRAGKDEFFILGMRSVAAKIERAIDKLSKSKYFDKNEYDFRLEKSTTGNQPRVEVTVFRK